MTWFDDASRGQSTRWRPGQAASEESSDQAQAFSDWLADRAPARQAIGAESSFIDDDPGPEADLREADARGADARGYSPEALEAARQAGFREGVEQVRAQLEATTSEQERALERHHQQVLDRLRALEGAVLERIGPVSVALARAMAEAVLGAELAADPARLSGIVEDVIARGVGLGDIELRVHPSALEGLEARAGQLADRAGAGHVELVADESLELGDVRVRSQAGDIEALVAGRLEQLAELARAELGFVTDQVRQTLEGA